MKLNEECVVPIKGLGALCAANELDAREELALDVAEHGIDHVAVHVRPTRAA